MEKYRRCCIVIYSFVTTLDSLHSLVAEGLNAELQRISQYLRREIQPASNEASLCWIFIIIPGEAGWPDACFEIVIIEVWVIVQISWWSSQLVVRLDLVNSDVIALYWTTV